MCDNVTFAGTYTGNARVPKGAICVLEPTAVISHNLTVEQGATLYSEGATVRHDLIAHMPHGIDLDNGATVGHDLEISKLQAVPAGEPANQLCNLNVGHNTNITGARRQAPIDMSCSAPAADHVVNDLRVTGNDGPVTVENASVGKDATVSANAYSVTVVGNMIGGDLTITHNKRPVALPRDVYAITTGYNNRVGGKAKCSRDAKGSTCKV